MSGLKGTAALDAKRLSERMTEVVGSMKAAVEELAKAKEEKDEIRMKSIATLIKEMQAQFAELEGQKKTLDEAIHMEAIRDEVAGIASKSLGQQAPADRLNAEPNDADRIEREHEKDFLAYLGAETDLEAKTIEGKAALRPKSPRLAGRGVLVPKSFMKDFAPRTMGKIMYSRTTGIAGPNPSAANNLVPQEFIRSLYAAAFEQARILDVVRTVPTTTGEITWPQLNQTGAIPGQFAGVAGRWISEGEGKPYTEPKFLQVLIRAFEYAAHTKLSERLEARSAINIGQLIQELFGAHFDWTASGAILTGGGNASGQPLGIVNTPGILTANRTVAGQVNYTDLVNLVYAVRPELRASGYFILNDNVAQHLHLKLDTTGRPLFTSMAAGSAGMADRLIGYRYIITSQQPGLGTDGDIMFGDPSHYIDLVEMEMAIKRSDVADDAFLKNLIIYKAHMVRGGRLMLPEAFCLLVTATS